MAIDFDAQTPGGSGSGVTSLTFAHTVTGSNPLVGMSFWDNSRQTHVSVTYPRASDSAATALTQQGITTQVGDVNWNHSLWASAFTPKTGANNFVVTIGSSGRIWAEGFSLKGCVQTGPHANGTNTSISGDTETVVVTPTIANSWVIAGGVNNSGNVTAGAGTTVRQASNTATLIDAGAPIATPAATTLTCTTAAATDWSLKGFAIAPAAEAPPSVDTTTSPSGGMSSTAAGAGTY
jgi:hypothetical protein